MGVRVVVTDRGGGVSEPPYDSLNLATHVGDDPAAVAHNRRVLAQRAGVPDDRLVVLAAVSGGPAAYVRAGAPQQVTGVEALVTTDTELALAVIAADCVPVLLADDVAGLVAVAHAGRRGVAAQITTQAVRAMQALGAQPDRVQAWVGPAICGACYEVGADVAAQVLAVAPAARATTSWGTTALDLPAAVLAELATLGVTDVTRDGRCTAEQRSLFSYRRDGRTGRQACLVVRSAP